MRAAKLQTAGRDRCGKVVWSSERCCNLCCNAGDLSKRVNIVNSGASRLYTSYSGTVMSFWHKAPTCLQDLHPKIRDIFSISLILRLNCSGLVQGICVSLSSLWMQPQSMYLFLRRLTQIICWQVIHWQITWWQAIHPSTPLTSPSKTETLLYTDWKWQNNRISSFSRVSFGFRCLLSAVRHKGKNIPLLSLSSEKKKSCLRTVSNKTTANTYFNISNGTKLA